MRITFRFLSVLFAFGLVLAACNKSEQVVDFDTIDLGVNGPVRSLLLEGDSIIACGGKINENGFVAVFDGALNHVKSSVTDLEQPIFSAARWNNNLYFGQTDFKILVTDSLPKIFNYFFKEQDWIVELYHKPFRQMLRTENGLIAITGGELGFGAIFQSYDTAQTWAPLQYNHELRSIAQNGDQLWVGGNGVLMRTTVGDTVWQRVALDHKFIVGIQFFDALNGIVLCYDGEQLMTSDGGESWESTGSKRGVFVNRLSYHNDQLLILCDHGVIGVSSDKGQNFQWLELEGVGDLFDAVFYNDRLVVAAEDGNLISLAPSALI
jgi:hypothetical protein